MKTKLLYNRFCSAWILAWALFGVGSMPNGTCVNASEMTSPTAEQVLEGHLKAMGGRAALEKIKTEVIKGTATEKDNEFDIEFQIQAPDKLLFLATVPNGMMIRMMLSSNGKGWREEPGGAQEMEGDMIKEMYYSLLGFNIPALAHLKDAASKLELLETETIGDKKLCVVRVSFAQGSPRELKYDAGSGLLAQNGKSEVSDYREVDGIKLPFSVQGFGGLTVRVKEVRFNVALKDGTFDKPAGAEMQTGKDAYRTELSPAGKLAIVRRPPPMNFGKKVTKKLPVFDPASSSGFQLDLRSSDCTALDLKDRLKDLLHADFDDRTKWPSTLAPNFEPKKLMESGKNPGLKVRELHRQGITGKGIGLAIIDQSLLVEHAEYRDRLRMYEEIHNFKGENFAAMHGPAVASIAVGKTVGVAPDADLYYIAETHGERTKEGKFDWDFTWVAKSIERIIEVNRSLPADKKIRVISISVGWSKGQKGYEESCAAVTRALSAGIFVISTSLEDTYKLAFHGLGRDPLLNPDEYQSYGPGSWWSNAYLDGKRRFPAGQRLLVPMDSRCTASPTGADEYVFYANGGWSWSVPYLAGLYALACQVNPAVSPEVFWTAALKTGNTVKLKHDDETLELGNIVNPVALMETLRK